ncbi:UTRA domain-containing protein [Streptomyces sp. NPDC004647]|uniref:UTRA domain-containing protein n=1 Tax=Streptomyces sp. NPDC004647 TaxID=3154671 RepID=UPI0033A94761
MTRPPAPAVPQVPPALRARWQDLPRLASLALRRLGPPPLNLCTWPTAWVLWLFALSFQQAGGGLLAYGSAMATVTGPRTSWARRVGQAAVFLLGVTLMGGWLSLVLVLPALTAPVLGGAVPFAYLIVGIAVAPLFIETVNMVLHARCLTSARTTARHLRRQGGLWWEAGTLLSPESDAVSAGRLVRACLSHADTARVGLVAVPATPALCRAYRRMGFESGPLDPRVLIRHPRRRYGRQPDPHQDGADRARTTALAAGPHGSSRRVVERTSGCHQWEKDRVLKPLTEHRRTGATEWDTGLTVNDLVFTAQYRETTADEALAEAFDIPAGTPMVERRYRTRYRQDGEPFNLVRSYLVYDMVTVNPDLLDASKEPWPGGTQNQLHTIGIELDRIVERITARAPTAEEAAELGLTAGDAVMVLRKTSIDINGRTVEVSEVTLPADRTEMVFTTPLAR